MLGFFLDKKIMSKSYKFNLEMLALEIRDY